ncbi:MAG: pyridoxine 5'-phosphate synthase [Bacteroidales bacterium]|jgi:pyridoxine 5-phosphate synthase|nr:pyridoxine 5'-phosphate synthase [Bacteroidales bacterium]
MTRLSVNINKIATLRNSRGGKVPDLIKTAQDIERFGAEGITVHPRPDERHIRYTDVYELKKVVTTEFNVEGYPSPEFIDLVCKVRPDQVTLVPDPPEALTSNAGWNTAKHQSFLREIIAQFKSYSIRTSIFVDTNLINIEHAPETGTDRIELYTEPYAANFNTDRNRAIAPFIAAAQMARQYCLGVNAGHDLNLENLRYFVQNIPQLMEVSIGHALISDALYFGLENVVQMYLARLN